MSTRRDFIKISGAAAGGLALGGLGFNLAPVEARAQTLRIRWAKETTTICPYCAVGCGAIVHTANTGTKRAINVEGDPDHVINRGSLCSKGASLAQLTENEQRVTRPQHRRQSRGEGSVLGIWPGVLLPRRLSGLEEGRFPGRVITGK